MKDARVLIDSFKDIENFNKEIIVERKGNKIKLKQKLLMKDDIYTITKERYKYLSEKGIVEEVKPVKENKQVGE